MSEIRLLVMPYELGRLRIGVGRGPEHLLEAGAEAALSARGATVTTEILELDENYADHSGGNETNAGFDLIRLLSSRVRQALRDGAFPVVLSGSCFIAAVGVVTGLEEASPSVLWLDSHGDFNAPDTTIDGYLDSMGLSILTGSAWQGLLGEVEGGRPVPETAVLLAGARDFDEPEKVRLDASEIKHLEVEDMHSPQALTEAIKALKPAPTGLYVHVDLDVLDADEARVNIYSVTDGVNADELEKLVGAMLENFPVPALSLTAYDPECDADDAVPPVAMRLLGLVAEHVERSAADGAA